MRRIVAASTGAGAAIADDVVVVVVVSIFRPRCMCTIIKSLRFVNWWLLLQQIKNWHNVSCVCIDAFILLHTDRNHSRTINSPCGLKFIVKLTNCALFNFHFFSFFSILSSIWTMNEHFNKLYISHFTMQNISLKITGYYRKQKKNDSKTH